MRRVAHLPAVSCGSRAETEHVSSAPRALLGVPRCVGLSWASVMFQLPDLGQIHSGL